MDDIICWCDESTPPVIDSDGFMIWLRDSKIKMHNPLKDSSVTYSIEINYCPMCARRLSKGLILDA